MAKFKITYTQSSGEEEVEAREFKDSSDSQWIDFYNLTNSRTDYVLRVRAAAVKRIERVAG